MYGILLNISVSKKIVKTVLEGMKTHTEHRKHQQSTIIEKQMGAHQHNQKNEKLLPASVCLNKFI